MRSTLASMSKVGLFSLNFEIKLRFFSAFLIKIIQNLSVLDNLIDI